VYADMTPLRPEDIAETVVFVAGLPAHVNVSEMLVLATDQSDASTLYRHGASLNSSEPA
jgi:3-hydroxy acid dehydrogenase / malonic semialdehyde reductase